VARCIVTVGRTDILCGPLYPSIVVAAGSVIGAILLLFWFHKRNGDAHYTHTHTHKTWVALSFN
jgi:hypothetical protein